MAAINHQGWEYIKFGEGWLRRERESDDAWESVDIAGVPETVKEQDTAIYQRHRDVETNTSVTSGVQPDSQGGVSATVG